jgi:hypothetical protein
VAPPSTAAALPSGPVQLRYRRAAPPQSATHVPHDALGAGRGGQGASVGHVVVIGQQGANVNLPVRHAPGEGRQRKREQGERRVGGWMGEYASAK